MGTHDNSDSFDATMHDPRLLSDSLIPFGPNSVPGGHDVSVGHLQSLSEKRRTLIRQVEDMRHQLKQGVRAYCRA